MRLSILCVRDYLSIFYSGLFHGSSVLGNPFQWASPACGKPELQLIYCGFSLIARTFNGSPNNVMNPSASWWSYWSPVVKEASVSL